MKIALKTGLTAVRPVPAATRLSIIEESEGGGERPLWRAHTLALAADGTVHGDFAAHGVAFSPAQVRPGFLYAARSELDAHAALANGAAGCISAIPLRGPHVLVADVEAAIARIARAARNRARATMTAVAGFGSDVPGAAVLHDALFRASRGMAWLADPALDFASALCTLASDRTHAIFDLDGNKDLAGVPRMLRPHLMVAGPELEMAAGMAMAVALQPGGAAVLPADAENFARWRAAALDAGAQVYGYGRKASADIRLIDTIALDGGTTLVTADMMGRAMCWSLAEEMGDAYSSLAIMGAMRAAGASLGAAALALGAIPTPEPELLAIAV